MEHVWRNLKDTERRGRPTQLLHPTRGRSLARGLRRSFARRGASLSWEVGAARRVSSKPLCRRQMPPEIGGRPKFSFRRGTGVGVALAPASGHSRNATLKRQRRFGQPRSTKRAHSEALGGLPHALQVARAELTAVWSLCADRIRRA